jgi:ATP-dependent helicase/nuclease subunit B
MDDSRWPAAARPDPFLPRRLQRESGIPGATPERALAFARRVTGRLLASAPVIVMSHAEKEGDQELRLSPLIAGMSVLERAAAVYATPARHQFRSGLMESIADARGPALAEGVKARGGAALLKAQSACPFQAFAVHRLGAEAPPEPEAGLTALEQGIANHAALAAIWKEFETRSNFFGAEEAERAAAVERAVGAAHAGMEKGGRRRLFELDKIRLREILRQWLAVEAGRGEFTVTGVEAEREPFVPLRNLRADRIDVTGDGAEILIDYKSSSPGKGAWAGERPDDLQLPLYAVSAEEPPAAIAFAQLKPGACKFDGLAEEEGLLPGVKPPKELSWEEQLAAWRETIELLWDEFAAGRADVDPKDDYAPCGQCHLQAMCRVAESKEGA